MAGHDDHGVNAGPSSDQPFMVLLKSDTFDRCNSYSRTANPPLGCFVRPCAISPTVEGGTPTSRAIDAMVIPFPRRSDIRNAQSFTGRSLREPVGTGQRDTVSVAEGERHSVATLGENGIMPEELERERQLRQAGVRPGARVRYWREHRGMDRETLARKVGIAKTTLADLENGRTDKGKHLGEIAQVLGLNLEYVTDGRGAAETDAGPPAVVVPEGAWPFPGLSRSALERMRLSRIERTYLETKLRDALADIEAERRSKRSG